MRSLVVGLRGSVRTNDQRLTTVSDKEIRTGRKSSGRLVSFPMRIQSAGGIGVSTNTFGTYGAGASPATSSLAAEAFGYAHRPRRSETDSHYRCAAKGRRRQ